jgi:hypothetical protein
MVQKLLLLLTLLTLGSFSRNTEFAQFWGVIFPQLSSCTIFVKKCAGLHFGRFFPKIHLVALMGSAE